MILFPISFISNEAELTQDNVMKLLHNIENASKPNTKGQVCEHVMYLCYLYLYKKENPNNNIFLTSEYKANLAHIIKKLTSHPEITNFPKHYVQQIHLLGIDNIFGHNFNSPKLRDILEYNLHNHYVEQLNQDEPQNIDFKTMKHLYYYYHNNAGIGHPIGSSKNKKNTENLLNYYKKHKKEDVLKLFNRSELRFTSLNKIHPNVIMGILEDFSEPNFFITFMNSLMETNVDTYTFQEFFNKNDDNIIKIFNYFFHEFENNTSLKNKDVSFFVDLFISYQDYLTPPIFDKAQQTFDLLLDKILKKENENLRIPLFLISRAASQSFEHFEPLFQIYKKDNEYYSTDNFSISNFLLQSISYEFNYFEIVARHNNLKNEIFINDYFFDVTQIPSTKNQLAEHATLFIVHFSNQKEPKIENFEIFFTVLSNLGSEYNLDNYGGSLELSLTYHDRKSSNNIFSFISEYIRNEPIHIQTYFSDVLRESFGDYLESNNPLIKNLKEHKKLLLPYETNQAEIDIIALENHILNNMIPQKNKIQDKKLKF